MKKHLVNCIKDKKGKMLTNEGEIFKRLAEYVKQICRDGRANEATEIEHCTQIKIIEEEIADRIRKLPRQKATGTDDEIATEF